MEELIRLLKQKGVLRSSRLEQALREIDRVDFVQEGFREAAYEDTALPIGGGQTISQPYTVVFMLELLIPEEMDIILDVGYGSGWQSALLALMVGDKGHVYAIERMKKICGIGKKNIAEYPRLAERVTLFCRDATLGVPGQMFNGIIVAAEVHEVPDAWRNQLVRGGRLVYPQSQAIVKEIKRGDGDFSREVYPGFVFVPFVKDNAVRQSFLN